ncbi:MAG: C-terminal helicase domain-containing protein [Roseburia sp.]|nr:C-terminal helicase domain-containing protein [Roseburia sp.]MCM1202075.1 C-terminal helicase domain-containing protein [Bacteroides fragilis]
MKYPGKKENIVKPQKIFPVIAITRISAHRLGEAKPMFDMVIIDKTGQYNTAAPIVWVREPDAGRRPAAAQPGDPARWNDQCKTEKTACGLRGIRLPENSIDKTCLACDAVSDEILLHNQYRCHRNIIEFNNRTYYHSRLNILSEIREEQPLIYMDMEESAAELKNTAPSVARES